MLVESAQWLDRFGAEELLLRLKGHVPRLRLILADAAYQGQQFAAWVKNQLQVEVKQTQEPPLGTLQRRLVCSPTGHYQIILIPRTGAPGQRWVVERSFAWISRLRRLARDVEGNVASSEAFIALAFSRLVLRRLTRSSS
jgi:transposase